MYLYMYMYMCLYMFMLPVPLRFSLLRFPSLFPSNLSLPPPPCPSLPQMTALSGQPPAHPYLVLGSSLLSSFEQFILSVFVHISSLVSTTQDWSTVLEVAEEVREHSYYRAHNIRRKEEGRMNKHV